MRDEGDENGKQLAPRGAFQRELDCVRMVFAELLYIGAVRRECSVVTQPMKIPLLELSRFAAL